MAKKPVRIVLDSNVILSGLISDSGAPRLILDLLSRELPGLVAVTGRFNLVEIERNIKKKVPKALPIYAEYFPKLRIEVVSLPAPMEVAKHKGIIDDKDTPVLVSAIKGKADYLVTGDKKHFGKVKASRTFPFKVVSPSEFLEILAVLLKDEKA